ncbi:MAG: energy transducer TonB, partial [Rubrivivax sp.]
MATLSTPTPQVAPAQTPRRVQALADHRHCPPARHPAALRERGIEGAVLLRVKVDIEGRPADVQLLAGSGWRLFDDAALQQIRGCRFVPATQDGQAIDSWVEFPVRFALA